MRKSLKYITTILFIAITRAYDIYCTYKYTPTLDQEANPLVSFFGFGWSPLLLTISVLCLFVFYFYYRSLYEEFDFLPKSSDYDISNFIGYISTGKKRPWYYVLFSIPRDSKRFIHFYGTLFTRGLVFAGIVSTIMWILLNNSSTYKEIHSPALIYTILFLGVFVICLKWIKFLFSQYKSRIN